ncbi:MAG: discoidin domain-containing protein [Anaerolineae bacterium]
MTVAPKRAGAARPCSSRACGFELDLVRERVVTGLNLDMGGSSNDYPRGYVVRASTNRSQWQEVARNDRNDRALDVSFNPTRARYIRIEQTGSSDRWWWSIHEVKVKFGQETEPPPSPPPGETGEEPKIKANASHNSVLTGEDNLAQALDGRPDTRWSSRALQAPGMWFELDLITARSVSGLTLDNSPAPGDYPRKYIVRLSTDRQNWQEVSRNDNNDRPLDVSFSPRQARYIRIEQTGSADKWWSIYGVTVYSTPFEWSASASHNNNVTGPDNLMQALDNRAETRWSSREGQRPGMWFELDLNKVRTVRGLTLDTARSPQDYPRGYIVRVSTDRTQWVEVAKNERNDRAVDISFSPRSVRYIRVEQTGSTDGWWWSIHGITIKE